MSYDVEWSAGADFSQVMQPLQNIEKTLGAMERAANRGFGQMETHANRMAGAVASSGDRISATMQKMASIAFVSAVAKKGVDFLVDSMQEAAKESDRATRQLEAFGSAWATVKREVGVGLSEALPDVSGKQTRSAIETGFRSAQDFEAKYLFGPMLGKSPADVGETAKWYDENRRLQGMTPTLKQLNDLARQWNAEWRSINPDPLLHVMEEIADVETRRMQVHTQITEIGKQQGTATWGALKAADDLLDRQKQILEVKKGQLIVDQNLKFWGDTNDYVLGRVDWQKNRRDAMAEMERQVMSGNISTLRDFGSVRDAERLQLRQQQVDALDALSNRTDISFEDEQAERGRLIDMFQWKEDAMTLRFEREDAEKNRLVSSRGLAGGLAGANAGITQAALSGQSRTEAAVTQTAAQTKESARLLGVISEQLKKREAAVYR